jgi:hypothetical protein
MRMPYSNTQFGRGFEAKLEVALAESTQFESNLARTLSSTTACEAGMERLFR